MWLLRKLDSLAGTLVAATFGLAGSQLLEFIQQYRQRLGGHLAEAQIALRATLDNTVYRGLDATTRQALALPQSDRIAKLAAANRAMADAAGDWDLPIRFFWWIDPSIAAATLRTFQPALPLTLVALTYALAGMVLGWTLWHVLKALFAPLARFRRARPGLPATR